MSVSGEIGEWRASVKATRTAFDKFVWSMLKEQGRCQWGVMSREGGSEGGKVERTRKTYYRENSPLFKPRKRRQQGANRSRAR